MNRPHLIKQIEQLLHIPPLEQLEPETITTPAVKKYFYLGISYSEFRPFVQLYFGITGEKRKNGP